MNRRAFRGIATCSVIAAGWMVAYSQEWIAWRRALLAAVVWICSAAGYPVTSSGFDLYLGGSHNFIGPDCTYHDWFAAAIPLLWTATSLRTNLLRAAGAIAIGHLVNLLRISFALVSTANGHDWFWSHDAADYALWYGSLAILAWRWMAGTASLPVGPQVQQAGRFLDLFVHLLLVSGILFVSKLPLTHQGFLFAILAGGGYKLADDLRDEARRPRAASIVNIASLVFTCLVAYLVPESREALLGALLALLAAGKIDTTATRLAVLTYATYAAALFCMGHGGAFRWDILAASLLAYYTDERIQIRFGTHPLMMLRWIANARNLAVATYLALWAFGRLESGTVLVFALFDLSYATAALLSRTKRGKAA